MKPTHAQLNALQVLANASPERARPMWTAVRLWGVPSAANEGKVNALMEKMRLRGWVLGNRGDGFLITANGFNALHIGRSRLRSNDGGGR